MPDLLKAGVNTGGGGGGAGTGGDNLLVEDGGAGEVAVSRVAAAGTWCYDGGLVIVHLLQHLGEDGGIVHTAVFVVVQPLGQHRGGVLELGVRDGAGGEDGNSEHCRVLRQTRDGAGLHGPGHLGFYKCRHTNN